MAIVTCKDGKLEYCDDMKKECYAITYCRYCNRDASVKMYDGNLFLIGCECTDYSFSICSHDLGHTAALWNEMNFKEHGKSKFQNWEYKKRYIRRITNGLVSG